MKIDESSKIYQAKLTSFEVQNFASKEILCSFPFNIADLCNQGQNSDDYKEMCLSDGERMLKFKVKVGAPHADLAKSTQGSVMLAGDSTSRSVKTTSKLTLNEKEDQIVVLSEPHSANEEPMEAYATLEEVKQDKEDDAE